LNIEIARKLGKLFAGIHDWLLIGEHPLANTVATIPNTASHPNQVLR